MDYLDHVCDLHRSPGVGLGVLGKAIFKVQLSLSALFVFLFQVLEGDPGEVLWTISQFVTSTGVSGLP